MKLSADTTAVHSLDQSTESRAATNENERRGARGCCQRLTARPPARQVQLPSLSLSCRLQPAPPEQTCNQTEESKGPSSPEELEACPRECVAAPVQEWSFHLRESAERSCDRWLTCTHHVTERQKRVLTDRVLTDTHIFGTVVEGFQARHEEPLPAFRKHVADLCHSRPHLRTEHRGGDGGGCRWGGGRTGGGRHRCRALRMAANSMGRVTN